MPTVRKSKRRPSISRRMRIVMLTCFTLAAALVVGGMLLMNQERLSRNAAEAASYTPAPLSNATDERPVALFIGDSYSAGTGASEEANRWTTLVATEMGWQEENRANGGTGYITPAGVEACGRESCPSYQGVLTELSEVAPDTVLIAGGQNDLHAFAEDPEAVLASIQDTYEAYRAAYPDAELVAVGPSTTGDPTLPAVVQIDQAVQDAAAEVGATYVSLLDPNVITPEMVTEDGGHVDDAGHAALAERVLSTLR